MSVCRCRLTFARISFQKIELSSIKYVATMRYRQRDNVLFIVETLPKIFVGKYKNIPQFGSSNRYTFFSLEKISIDLQN